MKIGVPVFSYENTTQFDDDIARRGYATVNLGDNMQSIALRQLLQRIGIASDDIVNVDRDSLARYDGPEIALIMNAVFAARSFPISPRIYPIFIGFNCDRETIAANLEYLRAHSPIGCRDNSTREILAKFGVDAYVSGCATLTFERRTVQPRRRCVYIVYGDGGGAFPSKVFRYIPRRLMGAAKFVYHRLPIFAAPLSPASQAHAEAYASEIYAEYSTEATLVITPLHHVAAPALAAGVPLIICRKKYSTRFDVLNTVCPIYTPDSFPDIQWEPPRINIDHLRSEFTNLLTEKLRAIRATTSFIE